MYNVPRWNSFLRIEISTGFVEGKEPTMMTTSPSFTVATKMTDDYGKFEGGEGTKLLF